MRKLARLCGEHALQPTTRMPDSKQDTFTPISIEQLEQVAGGADIGGILSGVGQIADQFTGGKASPIINNIAGMVQSFMK